jgi:magnesium-transporting ATPase (P-type)
MEAVNFETDEALLTGESLPFRKIRMLPLQTILAREIAST